VFKAAGVGMSAVQTAAWLIVLHSNQPELQGRVLTVVNYGIKLPSPQELSLFKGKA
jgi:hypothetical protein